MGFVSGGYVIYNFDYIVEKPQYLCESNIGSGIYDLPCEWDEICEEGKVTRQYKIDWDSGDSLNNWVETLDLICVPNNQI